GPLRSRDASSSGRRLGSRRAAGAPAINRFLELRHLAEIFLRLAVVLAQYLGLFHFRQVLHGDVSIHAAHDAAALLLHFLRELLDLRGCLAEELVKSTAEESVVNRNGGQHAGMVKRSAKLVLDLAHALHDA